MTFPLGALIIPRRVLCLVAERQDDTHCTQERSREFVFDDVWRSQSLGEALALAQQLLLSHGAATPCQPKPMGSSVDRNTYG